MNDEDIKDSEFTDVAKGLTVRGKIRTAVLLGQKNGNLENKFSELCNSILQDNPNSFWVVIDSQKVQSPFDWCSQFARNLRTTSGVKLADLAKFALNTGKSLSPFKQPAEKESEPEGENNDKIAHELVKNFEGLLESSDQPSAPPHLVIAVKELAGFSDAMLEWMSNAFNSAIRKSKAFKGARFVFTCETISVREKGFFNQFGFEKLHVVEIDPPKKTKPAKNKIEEPPLPVLPSNPVSAADQPIIDSSPKVLKKNTLPTKLKHVSSKMGMMDIDLAKKHLTSFKDDEKKFLHLASYPYRISKYSLEHFANNREAALSYNWLSRQNSIYQKHSSGDLVLNEDLRIAARTIHASENPELAEKWGELSSVLDTFYENFPLDSTHWIPVNLQLLESFDQRILRNLFNKDELEEIHNFIEQHPAQFIEKDNKQAFPEEIKLLIRRYLELTERTCIDGLAVRVRNLWLKDQDFYNSQKAKMLKEKEEITSEIESTIKQVCQVKELRDGLLDDFRNPKKNKPQKVYSFTTSRALLVIGLSTIGASLLSETIGAYHAACGLALTLFGFFWPNVDIKRPAFAADGSTSNSNLTIETQQRSLNHRAGSLSNRVQVMKGNLDAVEKQLAKLGDNPPPPYLEAEANEG